MTENIVGVHVKPHRTNYQLKNHPIAHDAMRRLPGQVEIVSAITRTQKNGSMAAVPWLELHFEGGCLMEVAESDCVIWVNRPVSPIPCKNDGSWSEDRY